MKKIFDYINVPITIISIAVTVYVTIIATKANKEIKDSTKRIECISQKIDSMTSRTNEALSRIESIIEKIEPEIYNIGNTQKSIADKLGGIILSPKLSKKQNNDITATDVPPQLESEWEKAITLMNEKQYEEAINTFLLITTKDKSREKETYYFIAIAYAKKYKINNSNTDSENMLSYLRKAAALNNQKAQNLLTEYGES